jgi:hypothetical protein
MAFLRRHRVLVVLLGLGVLVTVLVGYRIKKQQAAAVPRRQLEVVVGVISGRGPRRNQPLAIAVIGGLMVSTFFMLILIPTLYVMFEERFPRTIAPIEDDGAPPRREAPAH